MTERIEDLVTFKDVVSKKLGAVSKEVEEIKEMFIQFSVD